MAWGALLTEHQSRLQRMVAFRLDPRLRRRIDARMSSKRRSWRRPTTVRIFPQPAHAPFPVAARHRGEQIVGVAPPSLRCANAQRRPRRCPRPRQRTRRRIHGAPGRNERSRHWPEYGGGERRRRTPPGPSATCCSVYGVRSGDSWCCPSTRSYPPSRRNGRTAHLADVLFELSGSIRIGADPKRLPSGRPGRLRR